MPKRISIICKGQTFGRLTAISEPYFKNKQTVLDFICECGVERTLNRYSVFIGKVKSCGCLKRETIPTSLIHNMSRTRIYRIHKMMIDRCKNPNSSGYKYYGGKGVTVCQEWRESFELFYKWALENGYNETLSIDRIDSNKNYTPDNCRFASTKEQSRNKTSNVIHNGKSLIEWVELLYPDFTKAELSRIYNRTNKGWDIDFCLNNFREQFTNKKINPFIK